MNIDIKQEMIFRKKLESFLKKYGKLYPEKALEYIDYFFLDEEIEIRFHGQVLNQIYQEIGVFDFEKDNTYEIFRRAMLQRMDINQDLLEVGCGYYPSLAKSIAELQTHGSVTAVDPNVVTDKVEGIDVIKKRFDESYDVEKYDMIYGLYPCEATIDMIKMANIYDKDLCLLACDCGHINNDPDGEVIEDEAA